MQLEQNNLVSKYLEVITISKDNFQFQELQMQTSPMFEALVQRLYYGISRSNSSYLDFYVSIKSHFKLILSIFGKHSLKGLLKQGSVEGVSKNHVTSVKDIKELHNH